MWTGLDRIHGVQLMSSVWLICCSWMCILWFALLCSRMLSTSSDNSDDWFADYCIDFLTSEHFDLP